MDYSGGAGAGTSTDLPARILMAPELVPEEWRPRGRVLVEITLTPEEARRLYAERHVVPELDEPSAELARLLTQGLPMTAIARRLRIAPRTLQRRVAGLRNAFGVSSTKELLARLGRFGL